ncbi:MAG: hypothetical protein J7497_12110, partial [Chitinophagaceae bacterium]|nr:hypothetical protein [Chitinophagaceae bacterium]
DAATRVPAEYVHAAAKRRFSAGAFYTVLVLALAMAGFIFYTLYNNKQYNLFGDQETVKAPAQPITTSDEVNNPVAPPEEAPVTTAPAIATDTVPQIIGTTPAPVTKPAEAVKDEPAPSTKESVATVNNNNSTANNIQEKAPVIKQEIPKTAKPVTEKPAEVTATNTQPATPPVAAPARQVIARYKVPSKANFYSSADENTLRSAYINGGNRTVEALEEKNGFIYVEYVNENGMMTKGWLSKKDLNPE